MKIKLFNKIADAGINQFDPIAYEFSEDFDTYDAIMVRSAKLHDVEFPADLKCIARALSCQQTDTIYLYFYFSISFISLTINSFNFFLSGRCSIYVDTNN